MKHDVDEYYRRLAERDVDRPGDSVGRAVHNLAAQCAAERAAAAVDTRTTRASTTHRGWRRRALFGTLAAATLAGLWVTPHFLPIEAPSGGARSAKQTPPAAARSDELALSVTGQRRMPPQPAAAVQARQATRPPALQAAQAPARSARSQASDAGAAARVSEAAAPLPAAPAAPAAAAMAQAVRPANPALSWPQAAASGDLLRVRAQLDQGAGLEARDVHGRTALMLAVLNGHAAVVEELLGRGADPNTVDFDGLTPLRAATAGRQPTIAQALRRAGAR